MDGITGSGEEGVFLKSLSITGEWTAWYSEPVLCVVPCRPSPGSAVDGRGPVKIRPGRRGCLGVNDVCLRPSELVNYAGRKGSETGVGAERLSSQKHVSYRRACMHTHTHKCTHSHT